MECNKCKKNKDITQFTKKNKEYKTCLNCRNQCRILRKKNKDLVSLYNKN